MIGIVPKVQSLVVNSYNWSEKSKSILLSPTGPFTGIDCHLFKSTSGAPLPSGPFRLVTWLIFLGRLNLFQSTTR